MSMTIQVTMELLSDAIFGSGYSVPGGEDVAVCRDERGYPYFKGSTLKGLLRESLENLAAWTGQGTEDADAMLGLSGWDGTEETRRVHFTALTLPEETGGGRVTFVLTGRADSLLIRSGAPLENGERRGAYTPNLTENGRPVLPGSSIKGAVRARAEQIAAALGLSKGRTEALFGRGAGAEDNGLPGQVFFEDGVITQPQKKQISRIRINRFTGGVIRGGLFTEEPLRCDLELRISAPDAPADCGLLLYALRDLGAGLYNLGSGGAIGRGYVQVDRLTATLSDGRRASLTFDRERRCTAEDPEDIFKTWLGALEEERT